MKKKTLIKSLVFLIAWFWATHLGFGQSIFTNDIFGNNPHSNNPYTAGQVVDINISASGIGRGNGLSLPPDTNDRYNAKNWNTLSLDNNDYFEFTLTPNAPYEIDFVNFTYSAQRSPTGPSNIAIRSSLDNYSSDIETQTISLEGLAVSNIVELSSPIYQNIDISITFRVYAWASTDPNGTFSINDFTFNGIATPSPCTSPSVIWNGSSWDNGSGPDITTIAVINGNYNTSINGNITACRLLVNTGYTLTIGDNTHVEVNNDLTVNGGIIVNPKGAFIQNSATGLISGDVLSIPSKIKVEKETAPMNAWYEYTYWSSPVAEETIGNALSDSEVNRRFLFNAQNYLDATKETNNNNATVSGQDGIDDNGNDWQWLHEATIMQPGIGYVSTHKKTLFNIAMQTLPSQFKYTFEGPFNNGTITVPIYRNDSESLDDNWNLIGNPYPSAIDADLFLSANTSISTDVVGTGYIDGAIFLWSQNTAPSRTANGNQVSNFSSDDYAIINGTGTNAGGDGVLPNRYIPSGQAFFVSMSNMAPASLVSGNIYTADITFDNSMRVKGAMDNSQFFKKTKDTSAEIPNKLWIDLTSDNGIFNQTLIGYITGATNEDDGMYYDAPKNLSAGADAIIYTTIEGSNKKFAIQGKATKSINIKEIIKLGFSTTVDDAINYKLSIAQLEGKFLNKNNLYLKDNLLNKLHDLSNSDYTFTSEKGEFNDRFEILFYKKGLSIKHNKIDDNLQIITLENDRTKFITPHNLSIKTVTIFDLSGRQLYCFKGNISQETYNISHLKGLVYIAKITLSNGMVITKKAIKN